MNNLGSNLNSARFAGLALVALLIAFAVPAVALAQDPSIDQYAPGTPDAGGETSPDPDPVTNSGGQGGFGGDSGGGSQANGGGGGSSAGSPDEVTDAITPAAGVVDSSNASPGVAATAADEPAENKAQRDLAGIAAVAEQQRQVTAETSPDANPATELLRSDSGGGPGMGVFLWIVLGATLAWAVGSGVIRHRKDGQPA